MLFTDNERKVYVSPAGEKYDPLAVDHALVVHSGGKLDDWLSTWCSTESSETERAYSAIQLAKVTRAAFGFKPFDQPDGKLDAEVLETLYHFQEWLAKKE